ncbi:polysaccharide deacetylase family protein [Pirellulaceae bacterium SH449]
MTHRRSLCILFSLSVLFVWTLSDITPAPAAQNDTTLEQIPEKLVVLTFDDSARSHFETVRPILLKYGFGATFFVTEGFDFKDNKKDYMTWEEISQLHRDGFEIGNHTRDHLAITDKNAAALTEQVQAIRDRCLEHNIPAPVSFAWPGNALSAQALGILREQGILFARRGGAPEYPYEKGRGFAYEPGFDHPLLIPSAGDARPDWELEDFVQAVRQARHGKIAVLQFHGVPDTAHSWVSFPTSLFELSMRYLAREGYQVIAMRDLARFVDPNISPSDLNGIIEDRKSQLASEQILDNSRLPRDDTELRFWLENMLVHHQFTTPEMTAATGMTSQEIQAAITRLGIAKETQSLISSNKENSALVTLPYPGGRHPRTGFRDGMLRPQRETKLSIFAPWEDGGYVVADFPEAIWWNANQARELLYLAHTHVPTRWDRQGITLDRLEWESVHREDDGGVKRGWVSTRTLPNGVTFGVRATPHQDHVTFEMWVQNDTDEPMTGVSVQQCVMLARLNGFEDRTNANKLIREPFVACKSSTGDRWVITAWESCQRGWANPPCPCIHSDPAFPDIPSGETRSLSGWVSFYEGTEIDAELERIQSLRQ